MRPDNVAQELYDSDQFDWVVLIVAGINNVRNEWPLSNRDLYNYSLDKYGDSLNSNRFFINGTNILTFDLSGKITFFVFL